MEHYIRLPLILNVSHVKEQLSVHFFFAHLQLDFGCELNWLKWPASGLNKMYNCISLHRRMPSECA